MSVSPERLLEKYFNDLEKKLEVLLAAKKAADWELIRLREKTEELEKYNRKLAEENKEIKVKYNLLQKDFKKSKKIAKIVTDKLTPTGGDSEIKESVEKYIEEIDKCIEILRRML